MFKCKDIAEHSSDYLDQRLSWQQKLAFKLHVFICKNCRRYMRQFQQTITSIKLVKSQPKISPAERALAERLRNLPKKP